MGEPRGKPTNIHVEEYKRPKFQVTLDAPKVALKLGGKVSMNGKSDRLQRLGDRRSES